MINMISNLALPIIVITIVTYGVYKKIDVYDVFIEGAKESFDMIFTMFPCLLGMIFAVNIFISSGILNYAYIFLEPLLNFLKIPAQIIPMIIMRPISGSSSLVILNNIFQNYGPDSLIGKMASVIQGSTDTTFYILTLYFGSIKIKKIRYSLIAGLFADLIGITSAIIIVNYLFG
ncbi:MAG: spore maturation protein [Bacilli bacterium]|nr:spore maturation protein [Bacilli bacterium]